MANKTIKYRYIDSQYGYTLDIIFTDNIKRIVTNIYNKWGVEEEVYDCSGCTLICISPDNVRDITKYALVFRYDQLGINLIAHECQYLSAFILTDRAIGLPGENNDFENMCWLTGHLNQMVWDIVVKEQLEFVDIPLPIKLTKLG